MNRPDPRSQLTQHQLDAAAAAVMASKVLFVESLRMRPVEIKNPLKPDHPIRILEAHLELQDREEKVIWLLDKEVTKALAQQFNMLLDEKEGLWSETYELQEEPQLPTGDEPMGEMKNLGEGLIEAAQEINPGTHDSIMIHGVSVPLSTTDEIEAKGTLPMGINRPEDSGHDGELEYLRGSDREHQHE